MPTPYAYFKGEIMPTSEANLNIMTHALHYGTAVFEGVRGNWNEEDRCHYLFRVREHFERLGQSSKIMMLELKESVDRLAEIAVELVEAGLWRPPRASARTKPPWSAGRFWMC